MTVTVRPATNEDIPWLLTQLIEFDAFYGTERSVFPSMEHAETTLHSLIAEQVFLVADNNHGSVGFIAGILTRHLFNPDLIVLSEILWWVKADARGGRAGSDLLSSFIAVGTEQADWIIMTLEANTPVAPASLERLGFRLKESAYLRELGV